jgi:hypothetical protein
MFPQLSTIQSDRSLMTQSRFHLAKGNPHRQAFPFDGLYYRVLVAASLNAKIVQALNTGPEGERAVTAGSPHNH